MQVYNTGLDCVLLGAYKDNIKCLSRFFIDDLNIFAFECRKLGNFDDWVIDGLQREVRL